MLEMELIPALHELIQAPHWVCFNENKMPFNPRTGEGAKADVPETWATYAEARAALARSTRYTGIGREVIAEEQLLLIDLDKCIDEDGNIAPRALDIIEQINSYTEKSPSGRGAHIWARGKNLPGTIAPGKDGIEMYYHGRYFTWTGNHLDGTPDTIEERGQEVLALYSQVRIARDKAKQAENSNGKATRDLSGNTPYGLKALKDECWDLAHTTEGRNNRLNIAALKLGGLIAGGELDQNTVESELYTVATQIGLEHREIGPTIRSGITSGMKNPRTAPVTKLVEYRPGMNGNSNGANPGQHEEDGEEQDTGVRVTQATRLLQICERAHFFKTPEGDMYAKVPMKHKKEIVGIGVKGGFRLWLAGQYYEVHHSPASNTALQQVIEIITSRTYQEAPIEELYTRVGAQDGKIYLDLANEAGQVVEITASGWEVKDESPVHFRSLAGGAKLPIPVRGGTIEELRPFLNLENDNDWKMIVAYILMMLHPTGPYPVLALGGEQGATKTTTTRYIRSTVDPNRTLAQSMPREERDLAITVRKNWVLALDISYFIRYTHIKS